MLDLENVTDNKEFWKTIKPFLSDKVTTFPIISLVEKGVCVSVPIHLYKCGSVIILKNIQRILLDFNIVQNNNTIIFDNTAADRQRKQR